jgi:hypothetical protein
MQYFSGSIWLFTLVFLATHLELSCFPETDPIFIDLLKERSSPNQYDMIRSPSITTDTLRLGDVSFFMQILMLNYFEYVAIMAI